MSSYIEYLFSLKGKTAIVTGSSRGIGEEIATSFFKAGANVFCVARSESPSNSLLKENYRQCDITDASSFEIVCNEIDEQYDGIDICVNAAGVTYPNLDSKDKVINFQKTLNVNLIAAFQCSEIVSRYMKNGGSIINVTSIGSLQAFPENPGYVASKGGLRMLSKSLALDFAEKNIRVNNLVPGYFETDMTKTSREDLVKYKERQQRTMLNRWGKVEDLAGAAIFLASDSSSYITGIDLVVDGGWVNKGL